jgi:hypothetical protein
MGHACSRFLPRPCITKGRITDFNEITHLSLANSIRQSDDSRCFRFAILVLFSSVTTGSGKLSYSISMTTLSRQWPCRQNVFCKSHVPFPSKYASVQYAAYVHKCWRRCWWSDNLCRPHYIFVNAYVINDLKLSWIDLQALVGRSVSVHPPRITFVFDTECLRVQYDRIGGWNIVRMAANFYGGSCHGDMLRAMITQWFTLISVLRQIECERILCNDMDSFLRFLYVLLVGARRPTRNKGRQDFAVE